MKFLLILVGALPLITGEVPAQTAGPGSVPGAQPVVTPDMRNAGSPHASRRDEKVPGLSRRDQKQVRKMSKAKSSPVDATKTN